MARRNDHSRDELRRMSLEAAEAILDREGAGALSVRHIAKTIGYTHGTLYLVFRNLDGLLLEVNGRTLDALTGALGGAAAATPAGPGRLHALAAAYLDFASTRTARWRLVFEHHLPGGEAAPDWLTEKIARGHALLDDALSACGVAPADRGALGVALWCAIHGVTVLALDGKLVDASGDALAPEPVLRRTVTALLRGAG